MRGVRTAREAAWAAELEALAKEQRKRVAAVKKQHEAGVRRQRELLKSLGVPDLSPEEINERARRRSGQKERVAQVPTYLLE